MKIAVYSLIAVSFLLISGCESARYVKSELTGTAKPEGGIQENIPISKTYNVSAQILRRATFEILDEQGYVYDENTSTGTIKTEPKLISDTSKFAFHGAHYSSKLFIKLEGTKVSYRAKFDKKSNLTMGEENVEFPEKENELRKAFFDALSNKLGIAALDNSRNEPDTGVGDKHASTSKRKPKSKSGRRSPR
ncbi:MAG: hypothetical protein HOP36_05925 [Methyloglobulus sp.]|nr:hypothetical protein [Methyloglobulus sp.]